VRDYSDNSEVSMDVSSYKFSDEEIVRLEQYRDRQQDARLKVRFMALLMLSKGIAISDVKAITGVAMKTIANWHHQYFTKGLDSLNSFQYKPKQPYLSDEQTQQTLNWVRSTNPAKLKQIRAYVIEEFGIKYTTEAIRKLLHKRGLKLIRPKVIPGNPPSEMEQEKKLPNTLT
jgi:transposase